MGRTFIVANWKMYLTLSQSVALAKRISKSKFLNPKLEIILCPSFIAMEEVAKVLRGTRMKLGAQDVEPERRGAFTGEVGLDDLHELGVDYVLVGHSERRRYFKESDALINKKLRAVLDGGMRPILCIGEPWSVRRQGIVKVRTYVDAQVRRGLRGVRGNDLTHVIIAYEPVWAIGTGRPDTPEDASQMHTYLKRVVDKRRIKVLYGGSVTSKNASVFARAPGVDGLLIGRASTSYSEFIGIVRSITA